MDVEDPATIQLKIEGCLVNDAGAYEEETSVILLLRKLILIDGDHLFPMTKSELLMGPSLEFLEELNTKSN